MKTKLCVFDLDGTLLNTIKDLGVSCNAALTAFGLEPIPLEKYPFLVGNGMKKLIKRASSFEPGSSEFDKVFQLFLNHYNEHSVDFTTVYPGILEVLETLKGRGVKLAVLSNKGDAFVKNLTKHYFGDKFFDAVRGASELFPLKPDPKFLLNIIDSFGFVRSEVLYIGDSNVDIETAKNAEVFSVGAVWGFRGEEELKLAGADALAYSPKDLLNLI